MRVLLLLLLVAPAAAQTEGLLQIESPLERFVLRQHALGRLPGFDPGAQPFNTRRALALLDSLDATEPTLSTIDRQLLDAYLGRTTAGLLGARTASAIPLYPNGRSFLATSGHDYALEASPLVDLTGGPALINRSGTETGSAWTFGRGLRAAGQVGRFFGEFRVTENQSHVPLGPTQRRTAPRLGYALTSGSPDPTYDYLRAVGMVGYRDRFVEVRAGRDRNRWGFASGSLFLSDYATEYDHVQLLLDVGPISFQAIQARFLDPRARGENDRSGVVGQRYGAFHRLAYRVGPVEMEAFESVIYGDKDDDGRAGFEPSYIVPFGLLRAVERDLGSPDNVLIGGGTAWRVAPGYRVYVQGLLDELRAASFFDEVKTSKWGIVVGAQVVDPGIPGVGRLRNTDLRVEYARIRPYVYSHRDTLTAVVHYGDVLGHPAGPNASDLSVELAVRPARDVEVTGGLTYTVRGRNTDTLNYGSDPLQSTDTAVPAPNPTLQGIRQRVLAGELAVAVRVLPDAAIGAQVQGLVIDDAEDGRSGVFAPQAFLRWTLVPLGRR